MTRQLRFLPLTFAVLLALLLFLDPEPVQAQPDWLDGFDTAVEQTMDAWAVPGLAIGIIEDSTVVYSKGFGQRNLETDQPVTPQTLFAIGSATKAFTAASLGILHDDGQLDWTTPVQDYLPRFRMKNEFASEEMTAVDLLTHRSGLPRHDLLWYVGDYSREELFRRLRYLESTASFRTTFQYQNLMYMTAGYLAGQLTGTTWEDVVQRRIFEPLGMAQSNFSVDAMQQTDNFAQPYAGGRDSTVHIDYRNIDDIGPAGSINSSVADMLPWVQLFLENGKHGDTQVIDEATMQQLMNPRITVENFPLRFAPDFAPYTMYALGWFVEPYRGHRLLHHGGNIDGFSALVSFMPDDGLGFVILTNKNGTPVPYILMYELIDRMLGVDGPDWNERVGKRWDEMTAAAEASRGPDTQRKEGTEPSHMLDAYVGSYEHPAYGRFTVTMEGDSLVGQYGPVSNTLRHYHYDVFTIHSRIAGEEMTMKAHFEAGMDGTIDQVALPMEPTIDPIVFERVASEQLKSTDYLQQFTGTYAFQGQTLTVRLRGGDTLTLTVPGQPTYELEPTTEGAFDIKDLPGFSVEFVKEGDAVARMILNQPNGTFTAERE